MPTYLYKCEKCGSKAEVIQSIVGGLPLCCGKAMTQLPTAPAMFKVKGIHSEGYKEGYKKEYLKSKGQEEWRDTIISNKPQASA